MEAIDAFRDKLATLGGRVIRSRFFKSNWVILSAEKHALQLSGKVNTGGEVCHSHHARFCRDRHDACNNWNVDSGEAATIPEIKEGVVVEK